LTPERVSVRLAGSEVQASSSPQDEKRSVRQFYEEYGWARTESGVYKDTAAFVDTRTVLAGYQARAMKRLQRALPPSGRLFLDAGCGALPSPDYAALSGGYAARVCVDFAGAALREARAKLGGKALCVQADITHLPFRDGAFNAELCAHVLYHVPAEEQSQAVHEFFRTLARGGRCVIVYTWPDCLMNRLAIGLNPRVVLPKVPGARWMWRTFLKPKAAGETAPASDEEQGQPPLYFHPHPRSWFAGAARGAMSMSIRCWQSVGLPFSNAFVPPNSVGKAILSLIALAEDLFPRLISRVGCYPLIIIRR